MPRFNNNRFIGNAEVGRHVVSFLLTTLKEFVSSTWLCTRGLKPLSSPGILKHCD